MMCRSLPALLAFLAPLALASCGSDEAEERAPSAAVDAPSDGASVVEVVARGLTFDAPDTIPAGWTTFSFRNESDVIHFALVERMPEGYGIEEQQAQVAPVFQEGLRLLTGGQVDSAMAAFGELPEWFGQIVFMGGPGLTSPGATSRATVRLEPGTYLIECYVKTAGIFHSYNPAPGEYGMVHEIVVAAEPSGIPEPTPTLSVAVSTEEGLTIEGEPTPGEHTIAVRFLDQTVHENFVGHDVHVARLGPQADLDRVASWIDWTLPGGLESPAPAPFIGGINELPAGSTGYFTVQLEPGEYALISEVSRAAEKGMAVRFEVEGP